MFHIPDVKISHRRVPSLSIITGPLFPLPLPPECHRLPHSSADSMIHFMGIYGMGISRMGIYGMGILGMGISGIGNSRIRISGMELSVIGKSGMG